MRSFFRLLIVSALSVLGGCNADRQGPLPYAVMPREANLLEGIIHQAGVEVTPPVGLAPEAGAPIANALAAALRELDIAAVAGQKLAGGHSITGTARLENGAIIIAWELHAPGGAGLGKYEARDAISPHASADAPLDATLVQALAMRTAAAFAPYFPAAGGAHGAVLRVFIPDIANAPGDGGKSLPLALRRALSAAGLSVAEHDEPEAIHIIGEAQLSELNAASQLVKLSWRVLGADGAEIGMIDQSNPVEQGSLDGNWGQIAYSAAAGAADGIIPLLQDYQSRSAAASSPADAKPPAAGEK